MEKFSFPAPFLYHDDAKHNLIYIRKIFITMSAACSHSRDERARITRNWKRLFRLKAYWRYNDKQPHDAHLKIAATVGTDVDANLASLHNSDPTAEIMIIKM